MARKYDELKKKLDILEVYKSMGVKFTGRISDQGFAECHDPFRRDEKPSAGVYIRQGPGRGTLHRFVPSSGYRENVRFFEACRELHPKIGGASNNEIYDFFAEQLGEPVRKHVATYDYADESGNLIAQKLKYKPKDFLWRRRDPANPEKWIWNRTGCKVGLYNLPAMVSSPGETVFICEGEKDADRLISMGLLATTPPDGAGKWQDAYNVHLRDRDLILLADRDEVGESHVYDVASKLLVDGSKGTLKVITFPDLPRKGDVSDWLDKGHTKEDLVARVKETPLYDPATRPAPVVDETKPAAQARDRSFRLIHFADIEVRPPEWIAKGFMEKDSLALIFGDPGTGKSFLAIDLAACVATSRPFHGKSTMPGPVVYIAGEGQNGIKRRFMAWAIHNHTQLDEAPLFISLIPAALSDAAYSAQVTQAIDAIANHHGAPVLVVIDTLARNFGPGDENSTVDMNRFIAAADTIRALHKAAVLIVHHSGHAEKNRARGSMALKGALDAEYRVEKDDQGTMRVEATKMKDAAAPPPSAFFLVPVNLPMKDEDGNQVTSAVLEEIDWAPKETKRSKTEGTGRIQSLILEKLKKLYAEHRRNVIADGRSADDAAVKLYDWKEACEVGKSSFYAAKDALLKLGLIKEEKPYVFLVEDQPLEG